MLDVITCAVVIVAFALIGLDSLEGYRGKRRRRLREQETDDLVVVAGPDDEVYIEYDGVVSPAARERMQLEMRNGGLVFMPPGGRVKAIRREGFREVHIDGIGVLRKALDELEPDVRARAAEAIRGAVARAAAPDEPVIPENERV